MTVDENRANEYNYQYFGFTGNVILESYKDILKFDCEETTKLAILNIKKKLEAAAKNPSAVNSAVEEVLESIITEYSHGADYGISKVEKQLKECFCIPDWFCFDDGRLAEDMKHTDKKELEREIEDLKVQLKNITCLTELAKEEIVECGLALANLETACANNPPQLPELS